MTNIVPKLEDVIILMFYLGGAITFLGAFFGTRMTTTSIKRTKRSGATKTDALFLSFSSPGFKRLSMFNSPDNIGLGIFLALSLEQIGAINDIKPRVDVNLSLYPNWPESYLSAARYYAIIGEEKKARDYLSVADTISGSANKKQSTKIDLLTPESIESIIRNNQITKNITSLDEIFEEIRDKPYQLLLARSFLIMFYGLGLLFISMLLVITFKPFN